MRRDFHRRMDKLEQVRHFEDTGPVTVRVRTTVEDCLAGKSLYQSALDQGLIPESVQRGERAFVLLPEKARSVAEWVALVNARQEYEARNGYAQFS